MGEQAIESAINQTTSGIVDLGDWSFLGCGVGRGFSFRGGVAGVSF
jgi:hypothetical protein